MSTRCSGRGGVSGNPPSPAPLDPVSSHMLVSSYTSFSHCHRLTNARVGSRSELVKTHVSINITTHILDCISTFQKDLTFRDSRLRIDRTQEISIQMDEVAQKDFTYRMSSDEYMRYNKNWWISLNTSGRNAPMKLRSDFSEALTQLHRLHRESGEERLPPIPFWQYQTWHPSSSSSSTSWWQWNDSWWSSQNSSKSSTSELVKERHHKTGRPVKLLLH